MSEAIITGIAIGVVAVIFLIRNELVFRYLNNELDLMHKGNKSRIRNGEFQKLFDYSVAAENYNRLVLCFWKPISIHWRFEEVINDKNPD